MIKVGPTVCYLDDLVLPLLLPDHWLIRHYCGPMGSLSGSGIVGVLTHDWAPCHGLQRSLLLRIAKLLLDTDSADY